METLTAKHEREEEVLKSQLLGDYKKEMNQLREQLDRANKVKESDFCVCIFKHQVGQTGLCWRMVVHLIGQLN